MSMEIGVDYGDGKKVPVRVYPVMTANGLRYRSQIHTHPKTGKRVYVEFDPSTGKVEIKEVK